MLFMKIRKTGHRKPSRAIKVWIWRVRKLRNDQFLHNSLWRTQKLVKTHFDLAIIYSWSICIVWGVGIKRKFIKFCNIYLYESQLTNTGSINKYVTSKMSFFLLLLIFKLCHFSWYSLLLWKSPAKDISRSCYMKPKRHVAFLKIVKGI